ncbi:hypothetical protein [Nitratireductor aquibiodomus]|uniref:hypothetical protein n=1 Tax=Nitratireductor aquibiodomus TaxID=204799 RepID=UPI0012DCD336|nr:hypothetical protein [Nitratireductor aquibiodomus]
MPDPKHLIVASVFGGLLLAAGIAAFAISQQKTANSVPAGDLRLTVHAEATGSRVCRPETRVTVNKREQGFYALYGEARYTDTRDGKSTVCRFSGFLQAGTVRACLNSTPQPGSTQKRPAPTSKSPTISGSAGTIFQIGSHARALKSTWRVKGLQGW